MCGIVAVFHYGKRKTEPVNHLIMNQYEDQHTRGKEGFGFIKIGTPKEQIEIYRATEPTKALIDLYLNPATMGIFHHRSPTASINDLSQTHPMIVENDTLKYSYAIIHNGAIQNATEIYKKHTEEQKFLYTTYYQTYYQSKSALKSTELLDKFNDSESLAIELAKFIENKTETIETTGNAAFIVLQCTKEWTPIAIHFGRNEGKPLNMHQENGELFLSSEGPGEEIKTDTLYTAKISQTTLKLTERPILIPPYVAPQTTHYYNNKYAPTSWTGFCIEPKCTTGRMAGLLKCAEHAAIKDIQEKHKIEDSTDPRPICLKPNCHRRQRTEMNIRYCKKHKDMAEDDTENPLLKTIGKTWDCIALGGVMCTGCQHEPTTPQQRLPIGYKTNKEREEEDNDPTEKHDITLEDISEGETAQRVDSVVDEYFEALEQGKLHNPEEYATIIRHLMEIEYDKVEKEHQKEGESHLIEYTEIGEKATEAELYLQFLEETEQEKITEESHQNTNYF